MSRKNNQQSLKDIINSFISNSSLKEGLIRHRIISSWQEIVGSYIASKTLDIYYKDGVLSVKISSSVIKEELSFKKKDLMVEINKKVGGEFVKEISIN